MWPWRYLTWKPRVPFAVCAGRVCSRAFLLNNSDTMPLCCIACAAVFHTVAASHAVKRWGALPLTFTIRSASQSLFHTYLSSLVMQSFMHLKWDEIIIWTVFKLELKQHWIQWHYTCVDAAVKWPLSSKVSKSKITQWKTEKTQTGPALKTSSCVPVWLLCVCEAVACSAFPQYNRPHQHQMLWSVVFSSSLESRASVGEAGLKALWMLAPKHATHTQTHIYKHCTRLHPIYYSRGESFCNTCGRK